MLVILKCPKSSAARGLSTLFSTSDVSVGHVHFHIWHRSRSVHCPKSSGPRGPKSDGPMSSSPGSPKSSGPEGPKSRGPRVSFSVLSASNNGCHHPMCVRHAVVHFTLLAQRQWCPLQHPQRLQRLSKRSKVRWTIVQLSSQVWLPWRTQVRWFHVHCSHVLQVSWSSQVQHSPVWWS